jgi:kynurenine formamidase
MPRLIDLSHPIEHEMVTYPGLPGPVITEHLTREDSVSRYDEGTTFSIGRIDMVANTGTYLDVPFHRFEGGHDLSGLSLEKVADLPGVVVMNAGPVLGPDSISGLELEGKAVLFATGWDRHWRTDSYGDPEHPFVTGELAAALVDAGAALVGIDSVNIDDTRGGSRPAHTALLEAEIPVVEHMTGLDQLAGVEFSFFAVPPKVVDFGTFPVRAFAIVD